MDLLLSFPGKFEYPNAGLSPVTYSLKVRMCVCHILAKYVVTIIMLKVDDDL